MHEPFSGGYYLGAHPEAVEGAGADVLKPFHRVVEDIKGKQGESGDVVVKELAYCVWRQRSAMEQHRDFFNTCRHVALVRRPEESIPSLVKQMLRAYGDIPLGRMRDAMGYEDLLALSNHFREVSPVMVVDSDELVSEPATVLGRLCNFMGFPFDNALLTWKKGPLPDWVLWDSRGWHEAARESEGFVRATNHATPQEAQITPTESQLIQECVPFYLAITGGNTHRSQLAQCTT